ncbi:NACHT domain-containing protein [Pleurotus pulmonarius]
MSSQPTTSNRFHRVKTVFPRASEAVTSLVKPREDRVQSSHTSLVRRVIEDGFTPISGSTEPFRGSVAGSGSPSSTLGQIASSKMSVALAEDPLLELDNPVKPSERSLSGPFIKGALAALRGILNDMNLPGASACQLIIKAVETYELAKSNVNVLHSLIRECGHVASVLEGVRERSSELSDNVKAALRRCGSGLDVLIRPLKEDQKKGLFLKVVNSSEDAIRLQTTFDGVGRLIRVFVFEITIAGYFTISEVLRSAEHKALADNIKSLPRTGAAYNSYNVVNKKRTVCLAGTRIAILEEIAHWIGAHDQKPIYLLTGHAGYGKSTIARTVAEGADRLHSLGASFFFSRDEDDMKGGNKFFSTIAYQLCLFSDVFASAIGSALHFLKVSDAADKGPAVQLWEFIIKPLQNLTSLPRPFVIVIDAFDECEEYESWDPGNGTYRLDIWNGLATLVEELPFIKVFLTSRPHPQLAKLGNAEDRLYLNTTVLEDSDPDIRRYLLYWLVTESDSTSLTWKASESEICALETMAAGHAPIATNPTPYSGTVLRQSLRMEDPDELQLFKTVIGTILVHERPMSRGKIASLLGLDVSVVRTMLDQLQAVILTKDKPQFHKSFVEYITNERRSGELCISQSQAHTELTFHCLRILGQCSSPIHVVYHAQDHVEIHYSKANLTTVAELLQAHISALKGRPRERFWVNLATYLQLWDVETISIVDIGTRDQQLSSDFREALAIIYMDLESDEVLPERSLRLMLTSDTYSCIQHLYQEYKMLTPLQYAKTLLWHLTSNGVWREHWVLFDTHHWERLAVKDGEETWTIEKEVDAFMDNVVIEIYGFSPTDDALSILRQQLINTQLEKC